MTTTGSRGDKQVVSELFIIGRGNSSVILTMSLPRINAHMTTAIISKMHASADSFLPAGAKLLDLTIDLSAVSQQDCPPISHYRIALREAAWLRRLDVGAGSEPAVGVSLALFSTESDEALDAAPARGLRVTIAGIVSEWKSGLWDRGPA